MQYSKASIIDSKDIASLHKIGIPTGFLSKQSIYFLSELYSFLIENELVIVAKNNKKVVGFIAVATNTSNLYKRFLRKNIILLIKFAIQNIFSIEFIKKSLETFNAPNSTKVSVTSDKIPELLSIVVDGNYKNKGIGKKLLKEIERELTLSSFKKYKVVVGCKLDANIFYKKNNFIKFKEIELHKGEKSFIYIKNI